MNSENGADQFNTVPYLTYIKRKWKWSPTAIWGINYLLLTTFCIL